MTAITGFIAPTRRPDALGVHSVDHCSLVVPDLAVARTFYDDFGLELREEGNGLAAYTVGSPHCWMRLSEGSRKQLHHVTFGAFADDMPRFDARLQKLGIKRLDAPAGHESNGIWFRDPDGQLLEIKVAEKCSPDAKSVVDNSPGPAGVRHMPLRDAVGRVRPRRFSHMLCFVTDVARSIAFYEASVGVKLSDAAGDGVAFLHGIHGSDHHMFAFAKSDGPGLHHLSWDMESTHAVGLGAMQMADKGFTRGWGLGRHVLGSNFFHYVRDPWGSYSEYSSDIDYIPVTADWESSHVAAENGFYLWGPTPPDDFVINFEAQSA
jgi:catechol 2,3-dioxygenase-like lactoylglutathione lyase family enzyme